MNRHSSLMDKMIIDCEKTTDRIVSFLRQKMKEEHKEGICLGISGGIDSAVVTILAVKATENPFKVHGLHLPDSYSQKKFKRLAQNLADQLQIRFQTIYIDQKVKERGGYTPSTIQLFRISSLLNRIFVFFFRRCYSLVKRRSMIVREDREKNIILKTTRRISQIFSQILPTPNRIASSSAIRHIVRREILEGYATKNNLLLVGTANRTESFIGWFVENGVDDLPLEAILGLYKNQVFQLARHLDVPVEILKMAPSPDMLNGVLDTDVIGFSYNKLDQVAYIVEHNLNKEIALKEGITVKEFRNIIKLHQFALIMHKNKHEFPLLD